MDGPLASLILPHDGRIVRAATKRFQEPIVFIHHFGGNALTTRRHQELVNELGFDAVSMSLSHNQVPRIRDLAKPPYKTWIEIWTDELGEILDAIPGQKIIFSLSSPSFAALKTLGELGRTDIPAWICDGGPFLNAMTCLRNFYRVETEVPRPVIPALAAAATVILGGIDFDRRAHAWVRKLPLTLPVLSIRGEKDEIVPARCTEKLFASNRSLALTKVTIPECGHLEGLKTHAAIYMAAVKQFLGAHGTRA
jgi:hypothetical protein